MNWAEVEGSQKRWFAVYTGFRKEKFVQRLLEKKGIQTYLPLLSKTKRYDRKIVEYKLPLIPMYLFVAIRPDERVKVLQTEYVFGFVSFEKKPAEILHSEIETLKRVVGENAECEAISLDNNSTGAEVELIHGALTGMKGKIMDKCGKRHFLVELTSIGYAICIEVEDIHLRLVA